MGSMIFESCVVLVVYFLLSIGQVTSMGNGTGERQGKDLKCTQCTVKTEASGHAGGEYCVCSPGREGSVSSSGGEDVMQPRTQGTCGVFNTSYNAFNVSFCYTQGVPNGPDECHQWKCDKTAIDIVTRRLLNSNSGYSCKTSTSQNTRQIMIKSGLTEIAKFTLSCNPDSTTTTVPTAEETRIQNTTLASTTQTTETPETTGITAVSEATGEVMTRMQNTTSESTTETTETPETSEISETSEKTKTGMNSAEVVAAVVGMAFLFLFLAAIVYKGMRMSSSNQTPQPKTSTVLNADYEGSTDGDRRDYAEITNSPRPADSTFLGGGERGSTQHDNLATSQSSTAHEMTEYNEYNEIGEQDYNVLFGGKERGIYHQYTMIPDVGRGQRQKDGVQNTGTGQYQELLMDEIGRADDEKKSSEGDAICGTRDHLLNVMEKGAKSKGKAGGSAATADHVYQPLLKAAGNKSLDPDIHLPTKSENDCSDCTMFSAHKSLKDCGPEYATLEPDTTNLSLDPVSSPANGFLSLNKDTSDLDDAVLESETSIHGGSDQSMDITHQPLRDCGPEYATLEPDTMDTTNQSLDPVSSSGSAFQSLNKDTSDPDYAVLEPETSILGDSDQPMDSTE